MSHLYIGLMSGSSLDGIDAVVVDFGQERPHLIAHHCHPIPADLKTELDSLTRRGEDELARMCEADARFGEHLAEAVIHLLQHAGLNSDDIHAIGSHGQTVRHYPQSRHPTTLQLGDPNRIAERTGITTVADLRRRDMAAGGQGAPLVPAFHQVVFQQPEEERAILNIGGIANLTLLPADPAEPVRGFDTGPGNALLDAWILRQRQQPFDEAGNWAASGKVQPALLERLLAEPFFHLPPPKSTGRDLFNLDWLQNMGGAIKDQAEDVQATLLELTARSIADALEQYAAQTSRVLVCGGGVHNRLLLHRLQTLMPKRKVETTSAVGIDPDWVEAMAFAWLARQTLHQQGGNLPQVTGAQHAVVLGGIYPGKGAKLNRSS